MTDSEPLPVADDGVSHPILVGPAPTPEADAMARARACGLEIDAALLKHRCALVSALSSEQVGTDGSKVLITARPNVVPLR
jgi:hypothetical protein